MPKKPPAKKPAAALEAYLGKRNFGNTPEPATGESSATGRSYVIQEHHARSHHFDFRLEIDGVLVSWAVPKGIPESPEDKRLAVHVEDHPLDYGNFEGEIPKGNYGAGKVEIWDRGTWEPIDPDWRKSFAKGKLKFALHGDRLNGAYVLASMREEPNWLLRQIDSPPATAEALEKESPHFISPQLAKVHPNVPEGTDWLHEIKLDGYRLIVVRKKGDVRLFTRTSLDWTDRFALLAEHFQKIPGGDFVMDGEAVVFDAKGRTDFGALQRALKSDGKNISFIAFDLLHHEGRNLRPLPLTERINYLGNLLTEEPAPVRKSKVWPAAEGVALFKQACRLGLEGIISKKAVGIYHAGVRRDWAKSKCRARQEFVICGYTAPKNSCPGFGALVLASFDGGKWIPRGKVGTGFNDAARINLLKSLENLKTSKKPFPYPGRDITWIQPQLVAEIEFAELTSDGSIRQGSFISMREDKPAKEVQMDAIQKAKPSSKDVNVLGITISHPERVVFPDDGITKLEVAQYYERVGKLMLPYIKNRPLAIIRAPDGIGGEMFFQKSFKAHLPENVIRKTVEDETEIFYIKDVKGLISLAQFGALEIHPWGSSLPKIDQPDQLIWDLDPDATVAWKEVLGTAHLLRDFLSERGLETIVKTSGGKGIHVILPLKRMHGWDVMKPFSKAIASAVAEFNPKRLLVNSSLKKRTGKIYIDFLRNGKGATCIAPWGLRARPGATVSTPLNWDDLKSLDPKGFTINEPFSLPTDWKTIKPQSITKAHLKEFSL